MAASADSWEAKRDLRVRSDSEDFVSIYEGRMEGCTVVGVPEGDSGEPMGEMMSSRGEFVKDRERRARSARVDLSWLAGCGGEVACSGATSLSINIDGLWLMSSCWSRGGGKELSERLRWYCGCVERGTGLAAGLLSLTDRLKIGVSFIAVLRNAASKLSGAIVFVVAEPG